MEAPLEKPEGEGGEKGHSKKVKQTDGER